jgi:hypothetical protein
MTRRMTLAVLCAAATACGGSDSGGNAAVSKEFTYGPASPATSSQASALQGSLTSALALQGSSEPSASDAQGVAQFSGVTTALLGSPLESISAVGTSSAARATALTKARSALLSDADFAGVNFDGACVVATSTSVTLNNCTVDINEMDGSSTVTGRVTANGSATLTNSNQTLTWDVTVSADVDVSGNGVSGSAGLSYHTAGTITVTPPTDAADGTIEGTMAAEMGVRASANGQTLSVGVHEALALNGITYQTTPSACVTGGTLEAKRVWTDWNVPGSSAPRPSDRAALVTFTGCDTATVQLSI